MVSASPVAGKEQILAEQDWKRADATASLEALAWPAPARWQTADGTPRTAQIFATLFVCGNGERRHRGERREEATARRQHPGVFLPQAEPSDFSWPPPERDLPESEFDPASNPARCKRVWIFSACFLSGRVLAELLRQRLEQSTASRQKRRSRQSRSLGSTNSAHGENASPEARERSRMGSRDQFLASQTDHGGTPLIRNTTKKGPLLGSTFFGRLSLGTA